VSSAVQLLLRLRRRLFPHVPAQEHDDGAVHNRRPSVRQLYTLSLVEPAATLRWFTAGGAIRIAVRQLSQTWKLRHYDVIDHVITRKL